jgi:hypothetical protein
MDRIPCRLAQSVAPYVGKAPDDAEFYSVMLNDISQNGFSFVATEAPAAAELVIALDVAASPRKMVAKVLGQSKCGGGKVIVDCEFLGQLDQQAETPA